MQLKIYTISLLLFWGVLTFISCQKELSCEACAETNKPPVANAGRDTIIILPVDSIMLDGTASHDPENNITAYQWTKISGPSSVYIVNSNASKTQVVSLVEGTYEFELKVTDGGSLFSRDTIQITVKEAVAPVYCDNFNRPEINTRLIPIGILPKFRSGMTIASAGNKIFFAGGYTNNSGQFSWVDSRVDIYDISTNTWSTAELSVPRYWITAIATGNKVFFAGGMSGDLDWLPDYHATVDIYDVGTSTWSVTNMSEAKSGVAAAAVGSKVFFAGGAGKETIDNTSYWGILKDDVEVYDFSTNTWSVSKLSEAKHGISAVTANNKIYFAGGGAGHLLEPPHFTSRIEIFDNASGTWAISYLSEPKVTTGIAVGNKIYYGGGWNGQLLCKVEIHDVLTRSASFETLSEPASPAPVLQNNKILFYKNTNRFDIYDIASNTWSIGVLPASSPTGLHMISVNNIIYAAGGGKTVNGVWIADNKVYKLEF